MAVSTRSIRNHANLDDRNTRHNRRNTSHNRRRRARARGRTASVCDRTRVRVLRILPVRTALPAQHTRLAVTRVALADVYDDGDDALCA